MIEVSPDQLKQAVESQHGGTATFVQAVPVHEVHNGETVWDGVVHVFDLEHQPDGAFRAYAWSYELEDKRRRFFAVIHTPKIDGPRKAVAAAIVAEHRARQERQPVSDRPICIHCGNPFDRNAGTVTDEVAVCDTCLGD